MKGQIQTISPESVFETRHFVVPTLVNLYEAVQGIPVKIPKWDRFKDEHCVVFMDGEAEQCGREENKTATFLWHSHMMTHQNMSELQIAKMNNGKPLLGRIAIVSGNIDFMKKFREVR